MVKSVKNTLIQAKSETTYGTAPSSFAATDALLVRDASITPISANLIDRNLLTGAFGAQPQLRTTEGVEISFTCELAGSGTAGTAPAWGKLLKACGWDETVTANSKVNYKPVSTNFPSISIHYVVDGTAHIALGCRGTCTVDLSVAQIPSISFTFTGLVGDISEINKPTINTTAWKSPIAGETINTPVLTLGGTKLVTSSLNIDLGSQVSRLEFIGLSEVTQTDRQVTGSCTFVAPKVSDKDYFAEIRASNLLAFALTHGASAGNIIEFAAPKVQLSEANYGDVDGVVTLDASLRFTPNTGNDEISITVK